MKRVSILLLMSAVCALASCNKTEIKEKTIYEDALYDVSSISLSESSLKFQTKATGLEGKTITLTAEGEADLPAEAFYVVSLDESVATTAINDEGEWVVTPVAVGETQIVATLRDKAATCDVEVRDMYFDTDFAQAIVDDQPELGFVLDDDGDIDVVENAAIIAELRRLDVSGCRLTSMMGLEYLTELKELDCYGNDLTSLDLSGCAVLEELHCTGNYLTSLDLSGCAVLEELYCSYNDLISLDLSGCAALEELYIDGNELLTEIDLSSCKSTLKVLGGVESGIESLDLSGFSALESFYCKNADLSSLDVTGCVALEYLNCTNTLVTSLDMTDCVALTELYCDGSSLVSIDLSGCVALTYLTCIDNPSLTSLDLMGCTALNVLKCGDCSLTSLVIPDGVTMDELSCYRNKLAELDISKIQIESTLYCGLQDGFDIDLYLTQAQYDGVWSDCDTDGNKRVTTHIVDL